MPVQSTPRTWLLTNATVLDPESGDLTPDRRILVVDGTIAEVGARKPPTARPPSSICAAASCCPD